MQETVSLRAQAGCAKPVPIGSLPPAEWNNTASAFATGHLVHQLVGRQALAQPNAVAIQEGHRVLTYAGLIQQSERWAALLQRQGVGPDQLVALGLERSMEFVTAALAVLQTGAAYLPLDPAWPPARLRTVLEESGAAVLLTTASLAEELKESAPAVLCWEDGPGENAAVPLPHPATPEHLAYVIYTSGSTGRPKGVEVTHRNLLNLVSWHRSAFGLQPGDRASLQASVGFDAAVWEIWPNLCAGASLHLPAEAVRPSAVRLHDWLLAENITVSFVSSAMAERLVDLEWPQETSLRLLLTGADTLHRRPRPGLPFLLVNNYGPTECTVLATSGVVTPEASGLLPGIGSPIANTRIYILDPERQPVPVGTPGEIYIAGACVARGYRNRPDLTSERFVPDPLQAGALMYRTGDRARSLPDGSIAFLGRIDDQIKLRGYRIEPQEIVEALQRHPQIQRSVVATAAAGTGEPRLVAWMQFKPGPRPTPAELTALLRQLLPEYMIPGTYVAVDEFVLNANGKVDPATLPPPGPEQGMKDDEFAHCRTPVEQQVGEILATLLNLDRVGANDNFFYLGGHSLLGTQVIARVRESLGVNLNLRTLFDHPTVAGLALEIERRQPVTTAKNAA